MRPLLALILGSALLAGGVAWLLLRDDPSEYLEPLVESPRPPVKAEPVPPVLQGRAPEGATKSETAGTPSLRAARNLRAKEHAQAVARYEAGISSIQDVEAAEMTLLEARWRLGEIDEPSWHRGRAVLFARSAERARLLAEQGFVPTHERDRARLLQAREEHLAGDSSDYASLRDALLAATKERHSRLQDTGLLSAKDAEAERVRLEAEFPEAR